MPDREQYTPGKPSGAQVRKDGEKWTLILVRELRHSPEKVSEALTDPAHLREWAPFEVDGSLGTVGTRVKLARVGAPAWQVSETTVTRADAPKVLEYNWGGTDIRWELEAFGGAENKLIMKDATKRSILRWIQIVFSIPILGYPFVRSKKFQSTPPAFGLPAFL